jgi:hypothetical protein
MIDETLSLCKKCHCMTKDTMLVSIDRIFCGKCRMEKK